MVLDKVLQLHRLMIRIPMESDWTSDPKQGGTLVKSSSSEGPKPQRIMFPLPWPWDCQALLDLLQGQGFSVFQVWNVDVEKCYGISHLHHTTGWHKAVLFEFWVQNHCQSQSMTFHPVLSQLFIRSQWSRHKDVKPCRFDQWFGEICGHLMCQSFNEMEGFLTQILCHADAGPQVANPC